MDELQIGAVAACAERHLQRVQDEIGAQAEQAQAHGLLAKAKVHLGDVETSLAEVLARTSSPHAAYLASSPLQRRILNQAFFKRILVGEDNDVLGTTLTPAYAAVASGWVPALGQPIRRSAQTAQERAKEAVPAGLRSEVSRETPTPLLGARVCS